MIGAVDGDVSDAADYLARMFEGMGDEVEIAEAGGTAVDVHQHGLRIVRGLSSADRSLPPNSAGTSQPSTPASDMAASCSPGHASGA